MSRALFALLVFAAPLAAQQPRTSVRPLFAFENATDLTRLSSKNENVTLTLVQDGGVTEGQRCVKVVVPRGAEYGVLRLDAAARKDWRDFDYFAIDVTIEDESPYAIVLELWDARSKNYPTRCTFEGVQTRSGKQTLLYPINRAKRNGKEGRDWDELEPQDKIDMAGLTEVKLFVTPTNDRDLVFHIDNVRLLQEDAAKPKMRVPLPDGAIAFNFGSPGSTAPGFTTISADHAGFGGAKGLTHAGDGWPDLLAGTFVMAPEGEAFTFTAKVPDGEYRYWLVAGPIFRQEPKSLTFRLGINGKKIVDDSPTIESYLGHNFLYRFMGTLYSERPHALWNDYIDKMYPTHTGRLAVEGGKVKLDATNFFVSALVLVPAKANLDAFAAKVSELRIEAFEKTVRPWKRTQPKGQPGCVVFEPKPFTEVRPDTAPTDDRSIELAAAKGQGVVGRVAIASGTDLGQCDVKVSGLIGPGTIPASAVRTYWQEYRYDGDQLGESALVPGPATMIEKHITKCCWLWLAIPADAKPGKYTGTVTFQPCGESLPLTLEVYPFALDDDLPLSLGMYYSPRQSQGLPADTNRDLIRQQLQFMREIGFTATSFGQPTVAGVNRETVKLSFDPTMAQLAKEVGMGRHPKQYQMGGTLGIGRAIGRRLAGSMGAAVDRDPGIELRQPGFDGLFLNALDQYKAIIREQGLPVAVEVVDEPRETPNPWNRNLADTLRYADMVRRAGLTGFVTPMGDRNAGKDYTVLADYTDIVSVHAYKASAGLMERTRKNGKTLWLYNTGMDRFSWGFYNWAVGSEGRWEWHFCWFEDGAKGGYPGREWFNPFTNMHSAMSYAPLEYPGGMLFTSRFLDVAEGVNDIKYIHALTTAIARHEKAGTHAETVAEAKKLLAAIREAIPTFPGAKGLEGDGTGALVGQGLDADARFRTPEWRRKIAMLLVRLNAPPG